LKIKENMKKTLPRADVVGLQRLVALVDVRVGVGVVMAGGDGVVVVVEE
jgi:hypothetical protein